MITKAALKKHAIKVFSHPTTQSLLNSSNYHLSQQLNLFISASFSFGTDPQNLYQLKIDFIKSGLSHKQIIDMWNMSLQNQLLKIRRTLKTIQKATSISQDKLINDADSKIDRLCQAVCEALNSICQGMNWCRCGRVDCLTRIDPVSLGKCLKEYCFSKQIWEQKRQKNTFLVIEDPQCEVLTLKRLNGVEPVQEKVIEFLKGLKIDRNRKKCDCSVQWLQEIGKKY